MFLFTGFIFITLLVNGSSTKRVVLLTSPTEDTIFGHLAMTSWSYGTEYRMVVGSHTSHGPDFWDAPAISPTGDFQGMLILGRQTADSENLDLNSLLEEKITSSSYLVTRDPQLTISGVDNSEGTVPRAFIYCINEDSFCSLVKHYIYTLALRGFEFNARISIVPIVDVTSDTVITSVCWFIPLYLDNLSITNCRHESQRALSRTLNAAALESACAGVTTVVMFFLGKNRLEP
ncbi:hypothetical protein EDB85DRAFT_2287613 [Lactarius pseudohatsudake]|nr:hypothetical protein EDB85DRAFT_2287613 [Lactarius pseudohatsudake]